MGGAHPGGIVRVNGVRREPDYVIAADDEIEYDAAGLREPDANLDLRIVYDDADLLSWTSRPICPATPRAATSTTPSRRCSRGGSAWPRPNS